MDMPPPIPVCAAWLGAGRPQAQQARVRLTPCCSQRWLRRIMQPSVHLRCTAENMRRRPGQRGLTLNSLFYDNEVRADEEYRTDSRPLSAKELELAKR
jgi:hypothetical protein